MKLRTALIVLGVLAGLTVGASTAEAAKGVKKKGGKGGEHIHHGKVIHVDHKTGHFTIAHHHHSKKKKGAAAGAGGAVRHERFSVNGSTKFFMSQKKNRTPSSFAALHVGEHVTVASKKGHADDVVIHKMTGAKKKFNLKKKK